MNSEIHALIDGFSCVTLKASDIQKYILNVYPNHIALLQKLQLAFSHSALINNRQSVTELVIKLIQKRLLEGVYICLVPYTKLPYLEQILNLFHHFLFTISCLTKKHRSASFSDYLLRTLSYPKPTDYNLLTLFKIISEQRNISLTIKLATYNIINLISILSAPNFFRIMSKNKGLLDSVIMYPLVLEELGHAALNDIYGGLKKPKVPKVKTSNIHQIVVDDEKTKHTPLNYKEVIISNFNKVLNPTTSQALVRSYLCLLSNYLKYISTPDENDSFKKEILLMINNYEIKQIFYFLIVKSKDEIIVKHSVDTLNNIYIISTELEQFFFYNDNNEIVMRLHKQMFERLNKLLLLAPTDTYTLKIKVECISSVLKLISSYCFMNNKVQLNFITIGFFNLITKLFEDKNKEVRFRAYEAILFFFNITCELSPMYDGHQALLQEDKCMFIFFNKKKVFESALNELRNGGLTPQYIQVLLRIIFRLISLNEPKRGCELFLKDFNRIKETLVKLFKQVQHEDLKLQLAIVESIVSLLRSNNNNCNFHTKEQISSLLAQCEISVFLVGLLYKMNRVSNTPSAKNVVDNFGMVFDCIMLVIEFCDSAKTHFIKRGVIRIIDGILNKFYLTKNIFLGCLMVLKKVCNDKKDTSAMINYLLIKYKNNLDALIK